MEGSQEGGRSQATPSFQSPPLVFSASPVHSVQASLQREQAQASRRHTLSALSAAYVGRCVRRAAAGGAAAGGGAAAFGRPFFGLLFLSLNLEISLKVA